MSWWSLIRCWIYHKIFKMIWKEMLRRKYRLWILSMELGFHIWILNRICYQFRKSSWPNCRILFKHTSKQLNLDPMKPTKLFENSVQLSSMPKCPSGKNSNSSTQMKQVRDRGSAYFLEKKINTQLNFIPIISKLPSRLCLMFLLFEKRRVQVFWALSKLIVDTTLLREIGDLLVRIWLLYWLCVRHLLTIKLLALDMFLNN